MDTQTRPTVADTSTLGLRSVLVDSLPASLMTADAPDRYTVEAVFTRRPEKDEVAEILGEGTRACLTNAGYGTAELTIADRRLGIANTSLEELRDGLAGVIVGRLAEISASAQARRAAAAARFVEASTSEHERAAAVADLAHSIAFRVAPRTAASRPGSPHAEEDAEIARWSSEGGHRANADESRQE